jgi:hypothetical protein
MKLTGLHILLTYQCTFECDHCFVWGSPRQRGVFTIDRIDDVLHQAQDAGIETIYFEGGEPFLYYAILVKGVHLASEMGFKVGIVSNAYWATSVRDAAEWLQPLAGRLFDLTVSSDLFHCEQPLGELPQNALAAAKLMGIPTGMISIAQPEAEDDVMFRGRAAAKLVSRVDGRPWDSFTSCTHEDLADPGRVHLDPLGNLHICQGLVIGNVFQTKLKDICDSYQPEQHPICGLLLQGGPAALVEEYSLPHAEAYADACHLCYEARLAMRLRFPEILAPDQMYGLLP